MGKIKIILADDHPMVLEGIKGLLDKKDGEVIETVGNGRALVEATRRLQPNLILGDISMPGLNGLEAARQIKKFAPTCKIIFLTMHADPAYAREAFEAGGSGFLLKRSVATELQEAIRTVMGGRRYLTPLIDPEDLRVSGSHHQLRSHQFVRLTSRQREVLQLLAIGYSTMDIARMLNISLKTVEDHRTKIREGLGLHNMAELTNYDANRVHHPAHLIDRRSPRIPFPRGN